MGASPLGSTAIPRRTQYTVLGSVAHNVAVRSPVPVVVVKAAAAS